MKIWETLLTKVAVISKLSPKLEHGLCKQSLRLRVAWPLLLATDFWHGVDHAELSSGSWGQTEQAFKGGEVTQWQQAPRGPWSSSTTADQSTPCYCAVEGRGMSTLTTESPNFCFHLKSFEALDRKAKAIFDERWRALISSQFGHPWPLLNVVMVHTTSPCGEFWRTFRKLLDHLCG